MSVDNMRRMISVTGLGRAAAAADLLLLNLAVETQAVNTSDALAENTKQVAAVLSTLHDHGIRAQDIQTTQLSIEPIMARRNENDTHPPKIVGYQVRNGLSAKSRDIPGAGAVIDAAVQAGRDAIRIDSISFSFAEPSRLLEQARTGAIADAAERARQLTDGLGVGLGDVMSISESDPSSGPIREFRHATFAASAAVLPGESEVTVQVTVVYEIVTK